MTHTLDVSSEGNLFFEIGGCTGWEAWIGPAVDDAVLDEPGELTLGHSRVHHAQTAVVPDLGLAQLQRITDPVVLLGQHGPGRSETKIEPKKSSQDNESSLQGVLFSTCRYNAFGFILVAEEILTWGSRSWYSEVRRA